MTNEVYMLIHGQCVDVLCHGYADVYDGYKYNEGIYVKIDRALYGTIEAAKVWYDTLSTNGFKANSFDPCVFKKDFKGDQLTIKLVHMGTDDMITDFYTKPLQGDLFRKMRDKIMGMTN